MSSSSSAETMITTTTTITTHMETTISHHRHHHHHQRRHHINQCDWYCHNCRRREEISNDDANNNTTTTTTASNFHYLIATAGHRQYRRKSRVSESMMWSRPHQKKKKCQRQQQLLKKRQLQHNHHNRNLDFCDNNSISQHSPQRIHIHHKCCSSRDSSSSSASSPPATASSLSPTTSPSFFQSCIITLCKLFLSFGSSSSSASSHYGSQNSFWILLALFFTVLLSGKHLNHNNTTTSQYNAFGSVQAAYPIMLRESHQYQLNYVPTGRKFINAETDCRDWKGNLLWVNSTQEFSYVYSNIINPEGLYGSDVWIGYFRFQPGNPYAVPWYWTMDTDTPATFDPNLNADSNSDRCCRLKNGDCMDWTCDSSIPYYICKRPIRCNDILYDDATVCSTHGDCVDWDTCSCDANYGGDNCEFHFCYNVRQDNSSVCSSHGNCISVDTCQCDEGYGGLNCDFIACNGIVSTNTSVCSGRGTCGSPENCTCDTHYSGEDCELTTCFNVLSNDTSVCSSHGSCVDWDTCSCDANYGGDNCEFHYCYNVRQDNSSVCSSHGNCTSADTCQCDEGYGGLNCDYYACNGISSTNTSVCSGKGTCVAPENCTCDTHYSGENCELTTCFNILSNDTSVCSSHGECIDWNSCQCVSGYTGPECAMYSCFGVFANDTSVCSGHGACSVPNQCQCDANFDGPNCNLFSCYGILSNESLVCNARGSCLGVDHCSCSSGFSGKQCELNMCFGLLSNDSSVCSSHGTCISPDTCQCDSANFDGNQCQYVNCFGTFSNDSSVCSARGDCLSPDNCTCNDGYIGSQCELTTCNHTLSNDPTVCNGRGLCVGPDSCECQFDYVGDFCQFDRCDVQICDCPEGFYGENCTQYSCNGIDSEDLTVCNSRGTCWAENRTCTCESGYTGSYCDDFLCFGLSSRHPDVCSGHGSCSQIDTCSCDAGYFGENCAEFYCFGVSSNDTDSVCSGHGACTQIDTCSCLAGYSGLNCSVVNCFGWPQYDANVCSNRGTCVSVDQCECRAGFFGQECDLYQCYGMLYNDTDAVCSGHGACVAPDSCTCDSIEFYGTACEKFTCFLRGVDDPAVCSSNGECIAPNVCNCSTGWNGQECSQGTCFGSPDGCLNGGICLGGNQCQCAADYTGARCEYPICFGESADEAAVCSSRGECILPNQCSCNGTYYDDTCSIPSCFGQRESAACNYPKGTCIDPGDTCICGPSTYGEECKKYFDFFIPINQETHNSLPTVDDYITSAIQFPSSTFRIYSESVDSVYISTDGYISLNTKLQLPTSRSFDWNATYAANLLLFGVDDLDLRNATAPSGIWWYAMGDSPTSEDAHNLSNLTQFVRDNYANSGNYTSFTATWYFVVSVHSVGYYPKQRDKLNNIQVVLFCDQVSDSSFIMFNFRDEGVTHPERDAAVGLCHQSHKNVNLFQEGKNDNPLSLSNAIYRDGNTMTSGIYLFSMHAGSARPGVYTCNGMLSTNDGVCSGKGICAQNEQCICEDYFGGDYCERDCHSNSNPEWTGKLCSTPKCYNIASYDDSVCSGHGSCTAPDTCACETGYTGGNCSSFTCYNISMHDPGVCSGHGECVAPDICSCIDGYSHNATAAKKDCNHITCDGILAGTPGECNGRGVCIGPNTCTACSPVYWFGSDCNQAKRYISPTGNDTSNTCISRLNPCRTLQHAFSEATPQNEIILLPGTYYMGENALSVDKSVSIIGEDPSTVKLTFDSLSGVKRAIFRIAYQPSLVDLSIQNLTIVGLNRNLVSVIHSEQSQVTLKDVFILSSSSVVVEVYGYVNVRLLNSYFHSLKKPLLLTDPSSDYSTSRFEMHKCIVQDISLTSQVDALLQISKVQELTLVDNQFSRIFGSFASVVEGSLKLENSLFSDCHTTHKDFIYMQNCSAHLSGISMNSIHLLLGTSGSLMRVDDVQPLNLTRCYFNDIQGTKGIVLSSTNSDVIVKETSFLNVMRIERNSSAAFLSGDSSSVSLNGKGKLQVLSSNFSHSGTAFHVSGAMGVFFSNSSFHNLTDGAIQIGSNYNVDEAVQIQSCTFSLIQNTNGYGAVTHFWGEGSMNILNCHFEACSSMSGGAVAVDTLNTIIIQKSMFTACSANQLGGSIYVNNANHTLIEDSTFTRGVARLGGAIYSTRVVEKYLFLRSGGLTIRKSLLRENHATESGGTIYAGVENVVKIYKSRFESNTAGQSGGVIMMDGALMESNLNGSSVQQILQKGASFGELLRKEELPGFVLSHSTLFNNSASVGGSISLFSSGVDALIEGSRFLSSRAVTSGGSIYALCRDLSFHGSLVEDSRAEQGAGIFVMMTMEGVSISQSNFTLCEGEKGACIEVHSSSLPLKVASSRISQCYTERGGAGIFVSGVSLQVFDSHFEANRGRNGTCILSSESTEISISGSTFSNNSATSNGGAIYVSNVQTDSTPTFSLLQNSFDHNSALYGGSIFLKILSTKALAQHNGTTFTSGRASFCGGDYFFSNHIPFSFAYLEDTLPSVGDPLSNSQYSRASSYGHRYASEPRTIHFKSLKLSDEASSLSESVYLFSGQDVKLYAEVRDAFNQVVQYYDGLMFEVLSTAPRVVKSRSEEVIQPDSSELRFDFTLFSYAGATEEITISSSSNSKIQSVSFNASVVPCDIGYRRVSLNTEDVTGGEYYELCEKCPRGSYSIVPGAESCQYDCQTIECGGGTSVEWALGFWNSVDLETGLITPYPCVNGYCSGGQLNTDYLPSSTTLNHTSTSLSASLASQTMHTRTSTRAVKSYPYDEGANCDNHRRGILCGECEEGYDEWRGTCVKCSKGYSAPMLFLYGLYFVVLCGWIHFNSQKYSTDGEYRILISFLQNVLQVIDFNRWASTNPNNPLSGIINIYGHLLFALGSMQPPMSAFTLPDTVDMCPFARPGYWYMALQLMENMILFIILFSLLLLSFFGYCVYRCRRSKKSVKQNRMVKPDSRQSFSSARNLQQLSMGKDSSSATTTTADNHNSQDELIELESSASRLNSRNGASFLKKKLKRLIFRVASPPALMRSMTSLLIMIHQPITNTVFSFLMGCFKVDGQYRLMNKTSLTCWTSSEYWMWAIFLFIPALLAILLLPIFFVLFLRANRKKIYPGSLLDECLQVFYDIYRPDYYWFELVGFVRKIALTVSWNLSLLLMLSYGVNGIHFILFSIIFSLNFLVIIHYNPYIKKEENIFDKICYFILIVLCCFQDAYNSSAESIGVVLSFVLSLSISLILIIFVIQSTFAFRISMRGIKLVLAPIISSIRRKVEPLWALWKNCTSRKVRSSSGKRRVTPYSVNAANDSDVSNMDFADDVFGDVNMLAWTPTSESGQTKEAWTPVAEDDESGAKRSSERWHRYMDLKEQQRIDAEESRLGESDEIPAAASNESSSGSDSPTRRSPKTRRGDLPIVSRPISKSEMSEEVSQHSKRTYEHSLGTSIKLDTPPNTDVAKSAPHPLDFVGRGLFVDTTRPSRGSNNGVPHLALEKQPNAAALGGDVIPPLGTPGTVEYEASDGSSTSSYTSGSSTSSSPPVSPRVYAQLQTPRDLIATYLGESDDDDSDDDTDSTLSYVYTYHSVDEEDEDDVEQQ